MNGQNRYDKPFPSILRGLMKEKGISQQTLAEAVGVARQTISQYMDGKAQPTIDKFSLIADFFDVSADYLLGKTPVEEINIEKKAISKATGLNRKSLQLLEKYQAPASREIINNFIQYICKKESIQMTGFIHGSHQVQSKGFYFVFKFNDHNECEIIMDPNEQIRWICHRLASGFEEELIQKYVSQEK
ncbi:MAG: helix-turn-helix transcriptional regulator [Clostridia bacterium]|nr:helix-turn-helix transcriptional regulator [Clostridia bacterium]